MIPSPLVLLILILAAYRLTRLGGWDDFPLAAKIRAAVIGERWVPDIPTLVETGERLPLVPSESEGVVKIPGPGNFFIDGGEIPLPGKQPSSEADAVRPAYSRPTLAHLVHCPFCLGWWVSLATWLVWLAWEPVLYGLVPLAISGAVGLLAKNLDA